MYLFILNGAHLKTINTRFQLQTAEGSIFLVTGMCAHGDVRKLYHIISSTVFGSA